MIPRIRRRTHGDDATSPATGPDPCRRSDSLTRITIGAFDDPTPIRPVLQMATESALPWIAELAALPEKPPEEEAAMAAHYASVVSNQHPDHDTETWPPA